MNIKRNVIIFVFVLFYACSPKVNAVNYIDFDGMAIDYDSIKNYRNVIKFNVLYKDSLSHNEYYKKTNTVCIRSIYDINKSKSVEHYKVDENSCVAFDNYDLRDFLYMSSNQKAKVRENDMSNLGQNFSSFMHSLVDLTYVILSSIY